MLIKSRITANIHNETLARHRAVVHCIDTVMYKTKSNNAIIICSHYCRFEGSGSSACASWDTAGNQYAHELSRLHEASARNAQFTRVAGSAASKAEHSKERLLSGFTYVGSWLTTAKVDDISITHCAQ